MAEENCYGPIPVGVLNGDELGVRLGLGIPLPLPDGVEGARRFDMPAPGGWNTLGGVGGGGTGRMRVRLGSVGTGVGTLMLRLISSGFCFLFDTNRASSIAIAPKVKKRMRKRASFVNRK